MDGFSKHRANEDAVSRPSKARGRTVEADQVSGAVETPNGASEAFQGLGGIHVLGTPGKPKGLPKTGGRRKGTKNRRTVEVEAVLRPLVPAAKRRLKALMESEDDKVAYSAAMGILSYVYGRPIDRQQVSGAPNGEPIALSTGEPADNREIARRLALIFTRADPAKLAEVQTREGAVLSPDTAAPASTGLYQLCEERHE